MIRVALAGVQVSGFAPTQARAVLGPGKRESVSGGDMVVLVH